MSDDLSAVKAGDTVYRAHRGMGTIEVHPVVVERTTKTRVILPDGSAWRRKDGGQVGDTLNIWSRHSIRLATPEVEQQYQAQLLAAQHRDLERALRDFRWDTLPTETLKAIIAMAEGAE